MSVFSTLPITPFIDPFSDNSFNEINEISHLNAWNPSIPHAKRRPTLSCLKLTRQLAKLGHYAKPIHQRRRGKPT